MVTVLTNNEKYIINMAMRRLAEGAYLCAVECCNRILEIDSTLFDAHFIKGCALYNLEQYDLSEAEFLRALKNMPLTKSCYSNLAMAAVKCGDSSVIRVIESAARTVLPNADLFMMCGILYADIQDYEKSFECFNIAHELKPAMASIYINAGSVMLERHDAQEKDFIHAICCFTKALTLSPLNKYAYYNRCKAYLKLKDGEKALNDADTLLFIERNNAGFYYIYGNALMLLERYDEAKSYYETAHSFGIEYISTESRKRLAEIKELCKKKNEQGGLL